MFTLPRLAAVLVLAAIVGAGVFLTRWEMPVPARQVEKPFDNDRFPR